MMGEFSPKTCTQKVLKTIDRYSGNLFSCKNNESIIIFKCLDNKEDVNSGLKQGERMVLLWGSECSVGSMETGLF